MIDFNNVAYEYDYVPEKEHGSEFFEKQMNESITNSLLIFQKENKGISLQAMEDYYLNHKQVSVDKLKDALRKHNEEPLKDFDNILNYLNINIVNECLLAFIKVKEYSEIEKHPNVLLHKTGKKFTANELQRYEERRNYYRITLRAKRKASLRLFLRHFYNNLYL